MAENDGGAFLSQRKAFAEQLQSPAQDQCTFTRLVATFSFETARTAPTLANKDLHSEERSVALNMRPTVYVLLLQLFLSVWLSDTLQQATSLATGHELQFDDNRTVATMSNHTMEESFKLMDEDKDGSLTPNEMKAHWLDTPARKLVSAMTDNTIAPMAGVTVFMSADKDADLMVDNSEFAHWCDETIAHLDRLENTWKTLDRNKDGAVTLKEFNKAHSKDLSEGDESSEFRKISGGRDSFSKQQMHTFYSTDDFAAADKNQDGFLSKEEMKAVLGHGTDHEGVVHAELSKEEEALDLDHSFEAYDLNKDGRVSQEEYNEHALEEATLSAHHDVIGDEKLEAALSGDDTEDFGEKHDGENEAPIEEEEDSLTEEETKQLLERKEDL